MCLRKRINNLCKICRGNYSKAFQANQEDVDQQALQRLFGFMQAWPISRELKVREIARSGAYDRLFGEHRKSEGFWMGRQTPGISSHGCESPHG